MKLVTGAVWLFAVFAICWIASQDVGLAAQAMLAGITVLAVVFLSVSNASGLARLFVLVMAGFIAVRYFAWRTEYSLPQFDTLGFWPGMMIYLAEAHGFLLYFLSFFVGSYPLRRAEIPVPNEPESIPSVDVFIPTYNEPPELVRVTMIAATQMRHQGGRVQVHLLDDGGTDAKLSAADRIAANEASDRAKTLKAMCRELGINYLTRPDNSHAKAGNINSALTKTSGDLVLVLDADHVPTEDILERTVGQFVADPELALLQTPHFFATPDPVERNLDTFSKMPSENEMFYGQVQCGLDFWNASFFCGSAALLRRSHLLNIGGIAGRSVTEDAETSLELHARGYRSGYINHSMVAGLSPATLASFIGQRTRWAQGMIQILLMSFPLFKRGLSLPQRLCYMNSTLYWLFPLSRLMFLIAPLFFIFFQLRIFEASLQEFAAFIVPHFVIIVLMTNHFYGKYRWPFFSDLYETLLSLHLIPAVIGAIIRPHKPVFKVTAKDESVDRDFVSSAIIPLSILAVLLVAAQFVGIWRWYEVPAARDHLVIVLIWNTLNLILIFGAIGVGYERRMSGDTAWVRRNQPISVIRDGQSLHGYLTAATMKSAVLRLHTQDSYGAIAAGMPVAVQVASSDGQDSVNVDALVHNAQPTRGGYELTLQFDRSTLSNERNIVRLVYGDSAVWTSFLASRQHRRSIMFTLIGILGLGVRRIFGIFGLLISGSNRSPDRSLDLAPVRFVEGK